MRLPRFRALLLVVLLAPIAGSTILITKDLGDLSRESEAIVVARVGLVRAEWNDEHTIIWTRHQLSVEETWKGDLSGEVIVSEPGGQVGEVGQSVSGAPSYRGGDRVLLFLHRDPLGQWRTSGWWQGAFAVHADPSRLGHWLAKPAFRHVIDGFVTPLDGANGETFDLDVVRVKVTDLAYSPAPKREGR